MELGESEKKRQVSKDERWARLDKRIKRARARHELAHLLIRTMFLVYVIIMRFRWIYRS